MSMQEKSNNLAGAINAAGKPLELKMSIPNDLVIVRRGDVEDLKQEAIFGVFRRDAVEWDKLNALLSNAPAIEQGEPVTPDFFQLDNGSDYWSECPDDAGIIGDLHEVDVGTKYDVFASHTYRQTYKVVKMPDDKDDDTLVELVSSQRQYYTTPQQPQSVADALEEAAKICDYYANSNFGSLVDSGQNGAYVCSKAIRALIKRNADGVE